ncbi:MAG TPA: glycosyltransferase family 2 protein [Terrimicrobiaceae bacterium]
MTISVVIPAYNGALTIAKAIESILCQTRPPEEIIVSDDCSTDETVEVASRYSPQVRSVRRAHNGGLSANRNSGVRASQGEWLLFLDQDDELLPHALESLLKTATQTGAGVVYGFVLLRGAQPEHSRIHGLPWAVGDPPLPSQANFWWTAVTTTGCALFRRSLIDEVGEFDETIWQAEDCEFWLRCGTATPFAHSDTVVLKKYDTVGSLGSNAAGSIWWRLYLQEKFLAWCAVRSVDTDFLGASTAQLTDHALKRIFHKKAWRVLSPVLHRARACNGRTLWYYRGVVTEKLLGLLRIKTSPSNLRTYTC